MIYLHSLLAVLQSQPRPLLITSTSVFVSLLGYLLYRSRSHSRTPKGILKSASEKAMDDKALAAALAAKKKVAVDKIFLQRLRFLLGIVLPSVHSKEFFILFLHTCFLVSRTLVSIYVAKLDGNIVKSIVEKNLTNFIFLMMKWMTIALPATYINSMILFLESKLSIAFRTKLTTFLYQRYMHDDVYYKVINLDSRLANPDQMLTEDVNNFCANLAHLYSHLSKPCLDIVLMSAQLVMLANSRGGKFSFLPLSLATLVIVGTGAILRLATPPFGRLIAEQAKLDGDLRAAHSRIITHSEEIAFFAGERVEHGVLQRTYDHLVKHMNHIYKTKILFTMLEQFMMKYVWGACGLVMIAIPTFNRPDLQRDTSKPAVAALPATSSSLSSTASSSPSSTSSAASSSSSTSSSSLAAAAATSVAQLVSSTHVHSPGDSSDSSPSSSSSSSTSDTISDRTQDFVTSRGLLVSAADAVERMMSSYKEVTELAGRTQRLFEMIEIFEEVRVGKFNKKQTGDDVEIEVEIDHVMVDIDAEGKKPPTDIDHMKAEDLAADPNSPKKALSKVNLAEEGVVDGAKGVGMKKVKSKNKMLEAERKASKNKATMKKVRLSPSGAGKGEIIDGCDYIELVNVPIVTPNGDVLVDYPGMSFKLIPGMHVFITGPNGCGKSSTFRIVGGLWPLHGGKLYKPKRSDLFYVPQKPYVTRSTFRDQFIYPDSPEDMRRKGKTDADLEQYAAIVKLSHVIEREGGWDSVNDWRDVLSGGEKQRVAVARLFYHQPKFALLDECTSAVSIDVEGRMYSEAQNRGITLLTISHRTTLFKYHTHTLSMDGLGGWAFKKNVENRMTLQEERTQLEQLLAQLPNTHKRLEEICETLGEKSLYLTEHTAAAATAVSKASAVNPNGSSK